MICIGFRPVSRAKVLQGLELVCCWAYVPAEPAGWRMEETLEVVSSEDGDGGEVQARGGPSSPSCPSVFCVPLMGSVRLPDRTLTLIGASLGVHLYRMRRQSRG